MRLTRVFLESPLAAGAVLTLPDEAGMHVARVLRARPGDALTLFNGDGREFAAIVAGVRGTRVTVELGEVRAIDRESPLGLTLVQSVPRGDRMDFVVQKATELGATRIAPVISARSVVRIDPAQAEAKARHWRAVAVAACEQCGRNRLPEVDTPRALGDYLGAEAPAELRLVLEPGAHAGEPGSWPEPPANVEVAIGPEGGFTDDELEAFRYAGFEALTLGPRVLRTETAALAAITWLQARFGDFRVPRPDLRGD